MIDLPLIWNSIPALLHGTLLTVLIATTAALIGLVLGTLLALGENSPLKVFRVAIWSYITLFRGTPMLVQILFLFYVLPQFGIMIPPFWAATLAIGMNSGAYISQMIRSGINAISLGQWEAAQTLGFNRLLTMRYIVLPQAFRAALPSFGNELSILVKDSSLASIIGVMELSKEASIIRSQTYDAFSILLAISAIYLILTAAISLGIKHLEGALKDHA